MTVRRHELTGAQWARLAPLLAELAPERPPPGRPNKAHRRILNGILWKIRTGAPWRDLPARYGLWQTVYSRFRRWRQAGLWDRLFAAVQRQEDAAGHLDWTLQFVDGSVIRAHQHAAGAKGGTHRRKRSAAVKVASARRCTSGPKEAGSR
jgi:transposase